VSTAAKRIETLTIGRFSTSCKTEDVFARRWQTLPFDGESRRAPGLDGAGSAASIRVRKETLMIRKLANGHYRLYSRKLNPSTGKRRNLGTFSSLAAAKKHEREVQYFKRH